MEYVKKKIADDTGIPNEFKADMMNHVQHYVMQNLHSRFYIIAFMYVEFSQSLPQSKMMTFSICLEAGQACCQIILISNQNVDMKNYGNWLRRVIYYPNLNRIGAS